VDFAQDGGKVRRGAAAHRDLLSIDPNSTSGAGGQGKCLSAAGQTDAALSSIDLAIAHEPTEELHQLRADIAARVEHERVSDMESLGQTADRLR
jgi:hypothetical protein